MKQMVGYLSERPADEANGELFKRESVEPVETIRKHLLRTGKDPSGGSCARKNAKDCGRSSGSGVGRVGAG